MITNHQPTLIKYCALAIGATALVVLAGWQMNIQTFKSILPSFNSMNPLVAIGFILCAAWLWLGIDAARHKLFLKIIPVIIFFMGTTKLIDTFAFPIFSADKFLFPLRRGDNQMAVTTALIFSLTGLMLFIYNRKKKFQKLFTFLFLLSVIITLFSLCSYLFKLHEILLKPPFAPMALNTCALFLLMNFAITFYFKDSELIKPFFSKGMGGATGRRLLPYALIIPMTVSWFRYRVHQSGVYNPEITIVLITVLLTFFLLLMIWDRARFLNKINSEKDDLLERFKYVNKATSDAIFDWDLQTNEVMRYKELGGFGDGDTAVHFNAVHPEDLAHVQRTIFDSLEDPRKDEYTFACRYKTGNEYKNIIAKAHIIRQDGKAVRVVGAIQDLTELKSLEQKLFQQEKNNKVKVIRSIIEAQEKERRNVAIELHDNVNQILTSCKLMLETAKEQQENSALIERTHLNIKLVINEIRQISHDLSPSTLEDIGLEEAIEQMIETINFTGKLRIKHHYINDRDGTKLKMDDKIAIFRIIQEQISNVVKYARADNVNINVIEGCNKVQIAIEDDGIGFDLNNYKKGLGLKNIENRVEYYEGTLDIRSTKNTGCKMDVVLNLS